MRRFVNVVSGRGMTTMYKAGGCLLLALACTDPCHDTYFCDARSGWRAPNYSRHEATLGRILRNMKEPPLRKFGTEALVVRCLIVPARSGAVSLTLTKRKSGESEVELLGKRLARSGEARAEDVVEERKTTLRSEEWSVFRAKYVEMRSGPLHPNQPSDLDRPVWTLEFAEQGNYRAYLCGRDPEREIRELCEWMYKVGPLAGNLMNGSSVVIAKQ